MVINCIFRVGPTETSSNDHGPEIPSNGNVE